MFRKGIKTPDPPGFSSVAYSPASARHRSSHRQRSASTSTPHLQLTYKKSWDLALTPAKSIPMNAFMMWMSGSGVQIFSILITAMLVFQPIRGILGTNAAFAPFQGKPGETRVDLTMVKLVFIALQLVNLGLGIWKLQSMGLLPTTESDWLQFIPPKHVLHTAVWAGGDIPMART